MRTMVTIIALPGTDQFGRNGWSFSKEHDDCGIPDAIPITMYIGARYRNIDDIVQHCNNLHGQLYFNPNPVMEPTYSTDFVDEMQDWPHK